MRWRNCQASLELVEGINARWPHRDRSSDGTIGDSAHATRSSDHNPWVVLDGWGIVRARDVDVDGIDAAWLFEELRKLGAAGDPRLADGGYLILNGRITRPDFSGWAVYTGSNRHDKHGHISFSRRPFGFDSPAGWAFLLDGITAPSTPEENVMNDDQWNKLVGERIDAFITPTLQRIEAAVGALIGVAGRPLEVEARLTPRIAGVQATLGQLAATQGGSVDLAAIEAVVEKGVADAVAGIETTVRIEVPSPSGV